MNGPRRTVGEAMTLGVISIKDGATLADAAKLLDDSRIRGVPVVDEEGHVVGVLSQTDLLRARVMEHLWASWPGLAVRHVMSRPAVTARTDMSLDDAAVLMEDRRIGRLVVVGPDGRTPIGILSTSDLVHDMAVEKRGTP